MLLFHWNREKNLIKNHQCSAENNYFISEYIICHCQNIVLKNITIPKIVITNHSKLNSVQLVKKDISNPFINFLSSFGCTYFAQFYGIYFTTYPACIPNNLHSSEIRGLCFMKFSYLYLVLWKRSFIFFLFEAFLRNPKLVEMGEKFGI